MSVTKEQITITALRLFWLRGYKYVALTDVARELGITKGGIYYYFTSKEELLHAAVNFLFERIEARYTTLFSAGRSLLGTLRAIIVERELECYAQQLLDIGEGCYQVNHINFVLDVMQNFPDLHARIDQSYAHCHALIRRKIVQAMEHGEIRAFDSGALATVILAIINGEHALARYLDTSNMREKIMDTLTNMLRP